MGRFQRMSHRDRKRREERVNQNREAQRQAERPAGIAYSRVIFKTGSFREKISFLQSFFREYTRLRETFPAFLLRPIRYYTMRNLTRDVAVDRVFDVVPFFLGTEHVPDIRAISVKKNEVVFSVHGQFDSHWFNTLALVMNQMLDTDRHTAVAIVYASGFSVNNPGHRRRGQNTYANRPRKLRDRRA